jgi:recombination protein RecT
MSTAIETTNGAKKPLTIKEHLASPDMIAQIARVIPKHLTPDRMARVALTALTRTPKLAECTPQSFFGCLLNLSQWGLEPDGRRAHLIPFGKECTVIIDYKGIVELCYRSGTVSAIHADVVRRGDLFEYDNGHVTKHVPWFLRTPEERPAKPGDVYAAYCIVQMTSGTAKHEVMSKEEIDAIRGRSRSGSSGPWVTDYNEMAKKTVFRRCSKWLPWSAEIHDAVNADDDVPLDFATQQAQSGRTSNTLAELMQSRSEPAAIEVESREPVTESPKQDRQTSDRLQKWEVLFSECEAATEVQAILTKAKNSDLNALELGAVNEMAQGRLASLATE